MHNCKSELIKRYRQLSLFSVNTKILTNILTWILSQDKLYFIIMKTLKEIKSTLSKHKQRLFSVYPIKSLAIFGSFARREQNDASDLDIVVEFNDKIGIRFIDLADELEKLIGFKVDLVSKKGIKKKYFERIKSDLTYV